MRRVAWVVLAICALSVLAWSEETAVTPKGETADPAAVSATEPEEPTSPVAGLSCGSEMKVLDSLPLSQVQGAPPCPEQIPCTAVGRKCRESNCETVELEFDTCQRPSGQIISCTNGNLLLTTCDCRQVLQWVCCDDESCACTFCPTHSQRSVCPS